MVPTVTAMWSNVVVEVPRDDIVMIAMPVNFGGVIVVVSVVVTVRAPIVIAVAVVAWVVTAGGATVVRGITLADLNAQA